MKKFYYLPIVFTVLFLIVLVVEGVLFGSKIKESKNKESVYVLIKIKKHVDIPEERLADIRALYLGHNLEATPITSIKSSGQYYLIRADGRGLYAEDSFSFENQSLSLNQRIIVRGHLDGEGVVYDIGEN